VFKLEELRRQELSTLSAGQLTRTNLAKAFINDPKILLLDEPTASLDPEIAAYIRDYILTQRRERGVSILFTSHNMPEVEEVCDRVLFINHGTIIADDKPANLARSLDFCRVQLMLSDRDAALLSSYCESTGKKLLSDSHGATVEMKERDLALFLKEITDRKIHFSEISIDKPTLEDYFLHMAKQKKSPITMDTII
jgi:ABC-2 type transport system ATP-binding protein